MKRRWNKIKADFDDLGANREMKEQRDFRMRKRRKESFVGWPSPFTP